MEKKKNLPIWILWAGALFCCMLWGSAPAMIKTGYERFHIQDTGSILFFAGLRFFISGLLVLMVYSFQEKKRPILKKLSITPVLILALCQTFGQYFFYYLGAANASGIMVSVLSGAASLIAVLLACLCFHMEKMTILKLAGCLLGFFGILVMNLNGFSFTFTFMGEGLVMISQLFAALSTVMIRIYSQSYSPVYLSGWQFTIGGMLLVLCGLMMGGHISWNLPGTLVLIWLSLVSAGAYTIWGILLSKWPVSSVSIFNCTIPIFGVLFSFLFLHEIPGWNALAALILIIVGILCINLNVSKKSRT